MLKPKRFSQQVSETIFEGIQSGRWMDYLPPVRTLCRELGVSYPTLQTALSDLAKQAVVEVSHGKPTRILSATKDDQKQRNIRKIALLSPSAGRTSSDFNQYFNYLAEGLEKLDISLRWRVIERIKSKTGTPFLDRLVRSDDSDCFILVHSHPSVQLYFSQSSFPAVVLGSLDPKANLPRVDFSLASVGVHAAGLLRAKGHRHALLLVPNDTGAGVLECMNTFERNFAKTSTHRVQKIIHEWFPDSVERSVKTILKQKNAPTACFVADPYIALVVHSTALRMGLELPSQLSLLVAMHAPSLEWMRPGVSHYHFDYKSAAAITVRLIEQYIRSKRRTITGKEILPDYVDMHSVTEPRPDSLILDV